MVINSLVDQGFETLIGAPRTNADTDHFHRRVPAALEELFNLSSIQLFERHKAPGKRIAEEQDPIGSRRFLKAMLYVLPSLGVGCRIESPASVRIDEAMTKVRRNRPAVELRLRCPNGSHRFN